MQRKILIVEDERWAYESLSEQLYELLANSISIDFVSTVREAVSYLSKHKPDLVFMDVHLGDGLSFDIFQEVKADFPVIFTTAYDQYALKAFAHRGYDYLLKPFELEDLKTALEKVAFVFQKPKETKGYKSRFLVKFGSKMKSIAIEEIAYFMADDKILFATAFNGEQFVIDETVSSLMPKLSPNNYFQVNRKFIVHIKAISEMHKISRNRIKLKFNPALNPQDIEVIVSEDRSIAFQDWLNS